MKINLTKKAQLFQRPCRSPTDMGAEIHGRKAFFTQPNAHPRNSAVFRRWKRLISRNQPLTAMETLSPLLTPAASTWSSSFSPRIRCMIVDDEPHAIRLLHRHIEQTPGLELLFASVQPAEILAMAERETFDLLFLDVEMPLLGGFDLLNLLKGKCQFILCSGHRKYALKGFEHDVCDYLLKPVTYPRFISAVEKAKQKVIFTHRPAIVPHGQTFNKYILLKGDRKHRQLRICTEEIDYIKAMGHYLNIVVKGEKKTILLTMKQLLQYLPAGEFIRVHQSYIVPLNRISHIDFEELGLRDVSTPIPIGDTYRKELLKALKES